ncbi:phospholipase/carboxylesterase [Halogranum amylolyticum]|uniref:Phospholipase/carboxylesterase n=1 Tax=Halogranum amylolyticum TaxID=660520 RepID=A0A1H8T766_9EURY|nr:dienelactone hydrolase family protein [Halogranum amylolyticum]SEO86772.1 phospholipase/carboxylesterase [Halogranum amylolyticum]
MSAALPLSHVHVEPAEPTDGPAPAVVVLHGRGADEEDLLPVAQQLPDELHVLSLRAPDRLMNGYTWYELDTSAGGLHESQPHAEEFRRSLDLVSETVESAVEAYGLDADRIGLLGFSQGCITSLGLLLEGPDRFDWIVGLHGYLAESHAEFDPDGIEGKPVFLGAGAADQIIPADRVERAADRLRELGADVRFDVYQAPHGVGRQELEDLVAFVEEQV